MAIASSIDILKMKRKDYKEVFIINIQELTNADSMGVLRTYSSLKGIDLSRDDYRYFKDCLSGYPPQIIYCVDLAEQEGIDYVKDNSYLISNMPEQISSQILLKCEEMIDKKLLYDFLAVVAKIGEVPMTLVNKICKTNKKYSDVLRVLRKFSVCYHVGAGIEYLKTNSFIQDYIERLRLIIPEDISAVLDAEINTFNKIIDTDEEFIQYDTAEIKYILKENLKRNNNVSSSLLYSTIFLHTVIELYNNNEYSRAIEIINETKRIGKFELFDDAIKDRMQYYLCQCLSRNHSPEFESQVEYFRERSKYIEYNFLKGFYFIGEIEVRMSARKPVSKTSLVKVLVTIWQNANS
ncbi:hypothetical protein SDC9_101719 [bioreactor metagenome]|uniref:Uncharacterized protein n=1 Tax=bioreactor metagenome TaxID=1076179 RepID=A0A645APV7_9ZZZZ